MTYFDPLQIVAAVPAATAIVWGLGGYRESWKAGKRKEGFEEGKTDHEPKP